MDTVRFHRSSLPCGYVYLGSVIYLLAMALIAWVLCTNPSAETSVRIQHDRGHTVITTGPYRFVRHPMYVGAVLMYLSTPLVWGSLWALAIGGVITVLFVVRTALEDKTLRREPLSMLLEQRHSFCIGMAHGPTLAASLGRNECQSSRSGVAGAICQPTWRHRKDPPLGRELS